MTLSERFDAPWKRITFLLLCLPFAGFLIAACVWAHAMYVIHVQDWFVTLSCHQTIATRELKLDPKSYHPEPFQLARKRTADRGAAETQAVESGFEYQDCVRNSYLGQFIARAEDALEWVASLMIASVIALAVMFSLNRIEKLVRWVRMT
jgi:hypothetical protein